MIGLSVRSIGGKIMNRYAKGRRYEYKTRDYLYQLGARFVVRSAGSKGPFDLIAVFDGDIWLIQVKVSETRPIVHAPTKLPKGSCFMLAWWQPGEPKPYWEKMK